MQPIHYHNDLLFAFRNDYTGTAGTVNLNNFKKYRGQVSPVSSPRGKIVCHYFGIMLTKITRTVVRSFSTTNAAAAAKPTVKPSSPDFSSGPCKKRPGWTVDALSDGALGRSHRSALGKAKLKKCIEDQKRILGIPDDYHLGIVPVSYLRCCFCMSLCSLMFILQQPPPSRSVTNTGQ